MPSSAPTVYWLYVDVHWSKVQQTADTFKRLGLPIEFSATICVAETKGIYRFLTASLSPSIETWVTLALNDISKVSMITDFEQVTEDTDLGCVRAVQRSATDELEAAISQHIKWFLFI